MKKTFLILAGALAAILSGCSSPPTVVQVPVGPDPFIAAQPDPNGTLEVYSAKVEENDASAGAEYSYNQRTDYTIYDWNGKEVKHVRDNTKGGFVAVPPAVILPAGTYKVKALAAFGSGEWVTVPVVIAPGRTTEVHLNGNWRPPVNTPGEDLVYSPAGFPLGWRAALPPSI